MQIKSSDNNRREALIRAAYSAIAEKGFEGLRLREVAAEAGIDHSTLHHHFPTKRDLVAAVLDYTTEQFRPATQPEDAPPGTLHEHLKFLGRMMKERPELHVVLREFDLHAARDADLRAIIARHEKGWRERLVARIRAAASEGNWPAQLDPVAGAELVIAVVKGASFNPQHGVEVLRLFERLLETQSLSQKRSKKDKA